MYLADAEIGGCSESLDLRDHPLWDCGATEMLASRLGGSHPGGYALADEG